MATDLYEISGLCVDVEYMVMGVLANNVYIVSDGEGTMVVDPSCSADKILAALGDRKLDAIVLTHSHFDHTGAAAEMCIRDRFNCPEFTSLCPITGQPDFATIYISYVPDVRMVESKSLKLYLFSFRNHGDFHEDCMNIIMKDLIALMNPKYIEVWGKFTPRGGISIDPYCNYGRPGTRWEEVAWTRLSQHDLYPEKVDNR